MKSLVIVVLTLLIAGCSTPIPPEHPLDLSWQERKQVLSHLRKWNLVGRLAVRNGNDSWQLTLHWSQQGDDYRMLLNGPFGAGRVNLIGDTAGVVLTDADGHRYYSQDGESLLFNQTGMRLPVGNMRYWVIGLPTPGSNDKPHIDPHGRIATMQQEGWSISMRRYVIEQAMELPQKIFISGHDLEVRMVVDEWRLGAPSPDSPLFENDAKS